MSYTPEKKIIIESENLTGSFNYGQISYWFKDGTIDSGATTVNDGIGIVNPTSENGAGLPVGKYWIDWEVVLEVSASGYGDNLTIQTPGTNNGLSPLLNYNTLNANPDIIRNFTEYTIGSSDYLRAKIEFELVKNTFVSST